MAEGIITTSFDYVTWTLSGIWPIDDYLSTIENKKVIESEVFSCEPCKDLKWKLSIYPDGYGDEEK